MQKRDQLAVVPSDVRKVTGKAVDMQTSLDPATSGQDVVVVVIDTKRNDAAIKDLAEVSKAGWDVKDADYSLIAETKFLVTAKAGPLAAGILQLESKAGKTSFPLSPSDKGVAILRMQPPGDVKVSVDYKSQGASKSLPVQTFELKLNSGKPVETPLLITDEVDVVTEISATAPKEKATGAKDDDEAELDKALEEKAKAGNKGAIDGIAGAISGIFSALFGLLVVGGVAYGLWWYIKNHQKEVQTALTQVGVPVNQDPADPTGAATPVMPAQPAPIQKIVLDPNAALIQNDPAPIAASAPMVKNPRLVADDGSLFLLQDGESTVGRDASLPIGLPDESSVSRKHATVSFFGGLVVVADLGSTNGTYVNGSKVSGSVNLSPGDVVQFGAKRFRYEE